MEVNFPEGNVDKPMSVELQTRFNKRMKKAVWFVEVDYHTYTRNGTAFCIDPSGLLVTAAHTVNPTKIKEKKKSESGEEQAGGAGSGFRLFGGFRGFREFIGSKRRRGMRGSRGEEADDDVTSNDDVASDDDDVASDDDDVASNDDVASDDDVEPDDDDDVERDRDVETEVDEIEKSKGIIGARRDFDKDNLFTKCKIVYEAMNFDLVLLKLVDENGKEFRNPFHYVSLAPDISRDLSFGIELYAIGARRVQGFHFLQGKLSYPHRDDTTDYISMVNKPDSRVYTDPPAHNFYSDRRHRLLAGLSTPIRTLHPHLPYLQMNFSCLSLRSNEAMSGMSGSAVFNSVGKISEVVKAGSIIAEKYGWNYGELR